MAWNEPGNSGDKRPLARISFLLRPDRCRIEHSGGRFFQPETEIIRLSFYFFHCVTVCSIYCQLCRDCFRYLFYTARGGSHWSAPLFFISEK